MIQCSYIFCFIRFVTDCVVMESLTMLNIGYPSDELSFKYMQPDLILCSDLYVHVASYG